MFDTVIISVLVSIFSEDAQLNKSNVRSEIVFIKKVFSKQLFRCEQVILPEIF